MPVVDLTDLPENPPGGSALLGLDLGEKTIGVAVSDPARIIASPLALIRRSKFTTDAEALFALAESRHAGAFVIGLPVSMSGEEGRRCQSVRAFGRNLLRLRDLPIAFFDERLSTAAVERVLAEADASRARRAQLVDKLAAAWILQGALERLRAAGGAA
ncbi:MAG TPA: Holliday junction resolvase RuvX [Caulobacteraceae bacterium]|nr:Holliday junction resolvase RuvX [Caulobacteraceae bacterium]